MFVIILIVVDIKEGVEANINVFFFIVVLLCFYNVIFCI